MKNGKIQLSVILPVFNSEKIIANSINSITEWLEKQNFSS